MENALKDTLQLPAQTVFYRLLRRPALPSRRLLLLHGGGVAGKLTWGGILPHLEHWDEILVPDLRGGGKTHYPDHHDHNFVAEEVVGDLEALLDHLGWTEFDLGGYSFGGLIAMLLKTVRPAAVGSTYLLEPALFGKMSDAETVASRELMLHAAKRLRQLEYVDEGLQLFLDAVAPNRNRGSKNEEIVRGRLAHRPAGLACAIECVFEASRRLDRRALVTAQHDVSAFIGERSHPEVYRLCQDIAASRDDWHCHLIQGADHALPFQKPEAIAALINATRGI
ncbi:MAG: alpha/beta fold hydrolase [Sulfuricella sp.]|nr:alpha/beta fold hydrolase [Sulfuricella sp.]